MEQFTGPVLAVLNNDSVTSPSIFNAEKQFFMPVL